MNEDLNQRSIRACAKR